MHNLLPYNGEAFYYDSFFSKEEKARLFEELINTIPWENDRVVIFGKEIITKRKIAWLGSEPFDYRYSKNTKKALPFTKEVLEIKNLVENITEETYNSCLLNLYHEGEESMGWHKDNEPELKKHGAIASISLGATRPFQFKHGILSEKIEIILSDGSLLLMKGEIQEYWYHQLPKRKKIKDARINLTFRTIIP